MTILYADDDADDCEIMAEALSQIDPTISIVTASDGREALRMLHNETVLPDTVFLDVNMPVMDGRECLKEMKNSPRLRDIPVVIYSTSTDKTEMNELCRLGAFGFVHKASNFQQLQHDIFGVIEKLRDETKF